MARQAFSQRFFEKKELEENRTPDPIRLVIQPMAA